MQLFKFFSIYNIFLYFSFFITFILIFFLSYKYLYLEQSIYLLNNKLNKLEIEYTNPNVYSNNQTSKNIETAEFIMNEIFNDDNISCSINSCNIKSTSNIIPNTTSNNTSNTTDNNTDNTVIIDTVDKIPSNNEIFDLKKDNEDKESTVSGALGLTGGGHATKKALMKLSIDKLKSKCEERKLSTDGTKNQLADRIIVYDNSVEITDITDISDI